MFPESPGIPDYRRNMEIRAIGVTLKSGCPDSLGTPVCMSRSQPELRIPEVTRNSGFPESPEPWCSRSHPEFRVPVVTRKTGFRVHPDLQVPVFTRSGYPESHGSPGSEVTRNSVFPELPRISGLP